MSEQVKEQIAALVWEKARLQSDIRALEKRLMYVLSELGRAKQLEERECE
jgi:hypothetical protein